VKSAVDNEGQDSNTLNSSNLIRENASLRIRIKQLELALARPELSRLERCVSEPAPAFPESPQIPKKIMSDFQTQTFGLFAEPASGPAQSNRSLDSSVKLMLPTRQWSKIIVDFSLVQLGWVHCAVDEGTFMKEHDEFWQSLVEDKQECLTNHGWIAVYLSILAVSSQNKGLHATCKLMCHRSERTSFMRQKYTISSYSMKASLVSSLQMSSCWARARQDCVVLGMKLH
jgi:hypothetical protein